MNNRDHPFNRSTRPLLERTTNSDDHYPTLSNYPLYDSTTPTGAAKHSVVSAPNAPQIMRGFHDFNYLPKTSFYGGYPYGSPPSPGRQQQQQHQQLGDDFGAVPIMHHQHRHPSAATDAHHFAFSDDSGVHTPSNGSSPNTSSSSVVERQPQQPQPQHAMRRNSPQPAPPPPPPQRYYVDDALYEDDDGYAGGESQLWRPYGGAHIAATKGPFIFGMETTTTMTTPRGGGPTAKTVITTAKSEKAAQTKKTKSTRKSPTSKKLKKLQRCDAVATRENIAPAAAAAAAAADVRSIKCVVVGDAAVGKTNLICSYLENRFVGEHIPTASDEFNFEVTVNEAPVHVTLCDTAGQDTLDALRQLSYPDSDVFVLCFSVVRPDTFRSLQRKWLPQFRRRAPGCVMLLVGTQADLRTDPTVLGALQRQAESPVAVADACAMAQTVGAQYVETSARYRVGVKDAFDAAIWQALLEEGAMRRRRGGRPLWRRMLCLA